MKTKIKSYHDEATDYHNKEMSKLGFDHTSLALITIDSVFKKMKTIIGKYPSKNANFFILFSLFSPYK